MPILEFHCAGCSKRFEFLSREGSLPRACPACGSRRIERQFAAFAVASGAGASPDAGCGSCPETPSCPRFPG